MRHQSMVQAVALAAILATTGAWAATAPADPCSLLPAAEVSKVLGNEVSAPHSTVAPRPFRNTAEGTDCVYTPKRGRGTLMFRVYFDGSAKESAELFAKLKMWFGQPTPVPGVGDDTYIDSKHGLHARKGNVRFYLELSGVDNAKKDQPLTSLSKAISARI